MRDLDQVAPELDVERLVEAELGAHALDDGRIGAGLADQVVGRIAGREVHQDEDQHHRADEQRDGGEEAFE